MLLNKIGGSIAACNFMEFFNRYNRSNVTLMCNVSKDKMSAKIK